MKRKIIITLGIALFVVATMIKLNFSKENNSSNISLSDLTVMAYADPENQYPIGRRCGEDECSKACGIPPFVYTAYGSWWHCKWITTPGVCEDVACNRECDAFCFE